MNDLTLALLTEAADDTRIKRAAKGAHVAKLQGQLARIEAEYAELDGHVRDLTMMRALLTGEAALLTSDDVWSPEKEMVIRIGRLIIAPPDLATDEQLSAYAETMRALREQAHHQARLAVDALNERRGGAGHTPPDGVPAVGPRATEALSSAACPDCVTGYSCTAHGTGIPFADPNPAEALPVIQPAAIEAPPLADTGDCVHCDGRVTRTPSGLVHEATARPVCYTDRPDSPYAELGHPFAIGADPESADAEAPKVTLYRVTFTELGRRTDITPTEIPALDIDHLLKLINIDAAHILDVMAETLDVTIDEQPGKGFVLRRGRTGRKQVGAFAVEVIALPRTDHPRPAADLVSAPRDEEEATGQ